MEGFEEEMTFEEFLCNHHISGWKGRAGSVSQFWQCRTLKPREEKRLVKVTQCIGDRAGLKTDLLTFGQVLSSPDSSTSPANLYGGGAGQRGKAIGPGAHGVLVSELPPNGRHIGEQDTPKGQKYFKNSLTAPSALSVPSHQLASHLQIGFHHLPVDRGCCQLCPESGDGSVGSLGIVAFSVRDSCQGGKKCSEDLFSRQATQSWEVPRVRTHTMHERGLALGHTETMAKSEHFS